jgi:hypothetical protein
VLTQAGLPHVEFIDGYITYVFDKNQAKSMILGLKITWVGNSLQTARSRWLCMERNFLLSEGDAFARKFRNQLFEQKLIKNNQIR